MQRFNLKIDTSKTKNPISSLSENIRNILCPDAFDKNILQELINDLEKFAEVKRAGTKILWLKDVLHEEKFDRGNLQALLTDPIKIEKIKKSIEKTNADKEQLKNWALHKLVRAKETLEHYFGTHFHTQNWNDLVKEKQNYQSFLSKLVLYDKPNILLGELETYIVLDDAARQEYGISADCNSDLIATVEKALAPVTNHIWIPFLDYFWAWFHTNEDRLKKAASCTTLFSFLQGAEEKSDQSAPQSFSVALKFPETEYVSLQSLLVTLRDQAFAIVHSSQLSDENKHCWKCLIQGALWQLQKNLGDGTQDYKKVLDRFSSSLEVERFIVLFNEKILQRSRFSPELYSLYPKISGVFSQLDGLLCAPLRAKKDIAPPLAAAALVTSDKEELNPIKNLKFLISTVYDGLSLILNFGPRPPAELRDLLDNPHKLVQIKTILESGQIPHLTPSTLQMLKEQNFDLEKLKKLFNSIALGVLKSDFEKNKLRQWSDDRMLQTQREMLDYFADDAEKDLALLLTDNAAEKFYIKLFYKLGMAENPYVLLQKYVEPIVLDEAAKLTYKIDQHFDSQLITAVETELRKITDSCWIPFHDNFLLFCCCREDMAQKKSLSSRLVHASLSAEDPGNKVSTEEKHLVPPSAVSVTFAADDYVSSERLLLRLKDQAYAIVQASSLDTHGQDLWKALIQSALMLLQKNLEQRLGSGTRDYKSAIKNAESRFELELWLNQLIKGFQIKIELGRLFCGATKQLYPAIQQVFSQLNNLLIAPLYEPPARNKIAPSSHPAVLMKKPIGTNVPEAPPTEFRVRRASI